MALNFSKWSRVLLPVVILCFGVLGAGTLVQLKSEPVPTPPQVVVPLVRVMAVTPVNYQVTVSSQGTVRPRSLSQLVPEVAGRVVRISPDFQAGSFFEKNEVLLEIDDFDYRQALIGAQADRATAELALAREKAEARVARDEWQDLGGEVADPLALHQPQLAQAEAALKAAQSRVELAQRNLKRTVIKAPFSGRVLEKNVDLGQFLSPGLPLARIHGLAVAEVVLPVSDRDLAYLTLPLTSGSQARPVVTLTTGTGPGSWTGTVVRTEGQVDPKTRAIGAVAEVRDPYNPAEGALPLTMGQYVDASIQGDLVKDVVILPRSALHQGDRVLVVDENSCLQLRDVSLLLKNTEQVIVTSGLVAGEKVCLSRPEAVTEGMKVKTVDQSADQGAEQ